MIARRSAWRRDREAYRRSVRGAELGWQERVRCPGRPPAGCPPRLFPGAGVRPTKGEIRRNPFRAARRRSSDTESVQLEGASLARQASPSARPRPRRSAPVRSAGNAARPDPARARPHQQVVHDAKRTLRKGGLDAYAAGAMHDATPILEAYEMMFRRSDAARARREARPPRQEVRSGRSARPAGEIVYNWAARRPLSMTRTFRAPSRRRVRLRPVAPRARGGR